MLLISFAMLSTRRTQQLITLFAWQGAILFLSTLLVAHEAGLTELYFSAALTLLLKVIALPLILHTLIKRLGVQWDNERAGQHSDHHAGRSGAGHLRLWSRTAHQPAGHNHHPAHLGIALAVILLSFLMMITRRKAVTQVIGFLAMENGLFFAATSATYGMPMVVELGIALDVLVAVFILGVFFFQIREQFDSLDLHHLETLKEDVTWNCCWFSACPLLGTFRARAAAAHAVMRAEVNVAFSLAHVARRLLLLVVRVSQRAAAGWAEQFFVDPFNVFLVALTAFVGFTTSIFSRPYMRIEGASRPAQCPAPAPLPQHVPAVHVGDAARAADQQHGDALGGDGGRNALNRAAGLAVPTPRQASKPRGNTSSCAASASLRRCSARSCSISPRRTDARRDRA